MGLNNTSLHVVRFMPKKNKNFQDMFKIHNKSDNYKDKYIIVHTNGQY